MKNTFYRPAEPDTKLFDEIIRLMRDDLSDLVSGKVENEEIVRYVAKLIEDAKPLPKNHDLLFWGFAEPETMPSDSRVVYFFTPSYLAVSMLAYIKVHGPKEAIELEGFEETLKKGLMGATARSFSGAGHDGLIGMIRCFDLFAEAKVHKFVDAYPQICPTFTSLFLKTKSHLEQKLLNNKVIGDYGEDYNKEADSVLKKMKDMKTAEIIFVYGTLLHGNNNHESYLSSAKFMGEAVLPGYALYNLGSYPGIKTKKGDHVKGEVYTVDAETLKRINQLENEGTLYSLVEVSIEMDGKMIHYVGTYFYLNHVEEKNYIHPDDQPWSSRSSKKNDLVWYAAYGSNMLHERFMHYINGGSFRGSGRDHKPCNDTSAPRAKMAYEFKHDMYYANRSRSWDNMGVSFLDVTRPGKAYGAAYLITEEQFEHLWREENSGIIPGPDSIWYNNKVELGTIQDIPVKTVTNTKVLEKNQPSQKYMEVLMEGLREHYPDLSEEEIRDYVESRNSL